MVHERVFRVVKKFSMVDLPMLGNEFTWSRCEVNLSMGRIDKFFISLQWEVS